MASKAVYVISKKGNRTYWTRIGTALTNRDGSLSVKLESLPLDGVLHIRDVDDADDAEDIPVKRPLKGTSVEVDSTETYFPSNVAKKGD